MLPTESQVWWTERLLELFPERRQRLEEVRRAFVENNERCYALYTRLLGGGVAREVARCVLPLTMYTEWYWKIDLHNLFHFLRLRMDPHAQLEIRAYAEAMAEFVKPVVPYSWDAFEQDRLKGTFLSADEKEALRPRGEDAQLRLLAALRERGYRERRLREVCRKLDIDERLVDRLGPGGNP
jgi:thymidylate synthase (FAD)